MLDSFHYAELPRCTRRSPCTSSSYVTLVWHDCIQLLSLLSSASQIRRLPTLGCLEHSVRTGCLIVKEAVAMSSGGMANRCCRVAVRCAKAHGLPSRAEATATTLTSETDCMYSTCSSSCLPVPLTCSMTSFTVPSLLSSSAIIPLPHPPSLTACASVPCPLSPLASRPYSSVSPHISVAFSSAARTRVRITHSRDSASSDPAPLQPCRNAAPSTSLLAASAT